MFSEDIEFLLEQKSNLKRKITKAMQELKEWFYNKIDTVKDFFRKVATKVKQSLRHVKSNDVVSRDVKHKGEVVFKKGTVGSVYINGVEAELRDLQVNTNMVINDSKRGISYVVNDDAERAAYQKTRVINTLKKVSAIGGLLVAISASCYTVIKSKEEKERKSTVNSVFDKMEKDKRIVKDVEIIDRTNKSNVRSDIFDDEDMSGGRLALSGY